MSPMRPPEAGSGYRHSHFLIKICPVVGYHTCLTASSEITGTLRGLGSVQYPDERLPPPR
jgi:hypothetical protein